MELKAQPVECIYCSDEGKISTLTLLMTSVDGAGMANSYVDTSGHHHVHDPNFHEKLWECTEGHRFRTRTKLGCPSCQFNRPVRVIAEKIDVPV